MLAQRCALEQHRLIIPISVTKPRFQSDAFTSRFSQSEYRALVDTGAQRTVLSHTVIAEQELMRTGHMQFSSLHGARTHSRYLAGIGLWGVRTEDDGMGRSDGLERSLFALEDPCEIVDMENNSHFDVILGFDILKRFSFRFDADDGMFHMIIKR
jgi:hypothetical protein